MRFTFMKLLLDIFETIQAGKPVCVCICGWSCEADWLVGGLIGKALHA